MYPGPVRIGMTTHRPPGRELDSPALYLVGRLTFVCSTILLRSPGGSAGMGISYASNSGFFKTAALDTGRYPGVLCQRVDCLLHLPSVDVRRGGESGKKAVHLPAGRRRPVRHSTIYHHLHPALP